MNSPLMTTPARRSSGRDRRYRIAREYCGAARPQHVACFCGDWIGVAPNRTAARTIVNTHQSARHAILTGEEQ